LPYLEQENLYRQEGWHVPQGGFICPSRRLPQALAPKQDEFGEYVSGGWVWAKTDYAANAHAMENRPKCKTMASFIDGTSNTIIAGEKAMRPQEYDSGTWYWDEPYFLGGSGGTVRGFGGNAGLNVLRDSSEMGMKFRYAWGAPHPGGVVFLFADGSVRTLSFSTSASSMTAFLSLAGGEVFTD
jgi:prepilin-type processing-associated H-X9-DG protein